jgi:hypothetical protein
LYYGFCITRPAPFEFVTCPKCNTDHAHRSHREGWKDYAVSLFQRYPYRCSQCGVRFLQRRRKAPENVAKPTATETEIRATRAAGERKRRRRDFLLYGSALLCYLVFLYFITRDRDSSNDNN